MKVGDRVFYGYEDCEITKMEGRKVTELRTGCISMSGSNLECVPYTPKRAAFAFWVESVMKGLHAYPGNQGLNWPSIHQHFSGVAYDVMTGAITESSGRSIIERTAREITDALSVPMVSAGYSVFR